MKKINLGFLALIVAILTTSSMAFATHTIIKCWNGTNDREYIQLKMGLDGQLALWHADRVGKSGGGRSLFSYLDQSLEMFEDVDFFKGQNGYAIVRMITTADSVTLGVSSDLKKGFYRYEDHGSGAGNQQLVLNCKPMITLY